MVYLYHSPRGFANEFTLYAGTWAEIMYLESALTSGTTERTTRRRAIALATTLPYVDRVERMRDDARALLALLAYG